RVWTVTLTTLVLTKLLRARRTICTNFVLADSALRLDQQDLFTANQIIHLKPLIGASTLERFLLANPFVASCYPNARVGRLTCLSGFESATLSFVKRIAEWVLPPSSRPLEWLCRRVYGWHLQRRAASWHSPSEVRLQSAALKLHTRSHRRSVLDRFAAI